MDDQTSEARLDALHRSSWFLKRMKKQKRKRNKNTKSTWWFFGTKAEEQELGEAPASLGEEWGRRRKEKSASASPSASRRRRMFHMSGHASKVIKTVKKKVKGAVVGAVFAHLRKKLGQLHLQPKARLWFVRFAAYLLAQGPCSKKGKGKPMWCSGMVDLLLKFRRDTRAGIDIGDFVCGKVWNSVIIRQDPCHAALFTKQICVQALKASDPLFPARWVSDDVWMKNATAHPLTTGVWTAFPVRASAEWWSKIASVSKKGNPHWPKPRTIRYPTKPGQKSFLPRKYVELNNADLVAYACSEALQDNDACPAVPDATGNKTNWFPYNDKYAYPAEVEAKIGDGLQCVAKVEFDVSVCSSCCCRHGLVRASLSSALVIDKNAGCANWLTVSVDAPARIVAGILRMIIMLRSFSEPCFENGRDERANIGTYITDIFAEVATKRTRLFAETKDYGWRKAKTAGQC